MTSRNRRKKRASRNHLPPAAPAGENLLVNGTKVRVRGFSRIHPGATGRIESVRQHYAMTLIKVNIWLKSGGVAQPEIPLADLEIEGEPMPKNWHRCAPREAPMLNDGYTLAVNNDNDHSGRIFTGAEAV